ncbi:cytochrome P450 alkane hydroxylase-like protein [Nemania abortiva]|nr:cytochrome P450 alkane hydroxylase-like protein [Nemania abortiva]
MNNITWTTLISLALSVIIIVGQRIRRRNALRSSGGFQPLAQYRPFDVFVGLDFAISVNRDIPSLHRHHQRFGHSFQLNTLSSNPTILTIAPENIQAIHSRGEEWGIRPIRLAAMEPFCGRGFLTTDGDVWRHARRSLRPSFARSNLTDLSVISRETDKLFESLPRNGETVDLQPLLYAIFLNTSLNFLLGMDSDADYQKPPCTTQEFVDAFHSALFMTMIRIVFGKIWRLLPKSRYRQACRTSHDFLEYYIHLAITDLDNKQRGIAKSKTLVHNLVADSDDLHFVRSQVLQGMLASQETISSLLGNTFFLLSRNQDYWQKIRAEVLGKGEEILRFEALHENKLLRSVLFESLNLVTLRLYPIFPVFGRMALYDNSLPVGGGPNQDERVFVPKGTRVQVAYYALHRDPRVFGEDVETFRPERWDTISPGQWEFMPFGGGMRGCLGREKSLVEAAFVLAKMALRYKTLESRDAREWKGELKLTCQNANGCWLSVGA